MQPRSIWRGLAVGLLATGLIARKAQAQNALTGVASSSEEGAMEGNHGATIVKVEPLD